MAQVEATTHIRAPLDEVYQLAKDVEAFPSFMPDVQSVKVLQRDGNRTVTEWIGVVQGRKVWWVEEDHWDDARHRCTFRQREGDFTRYEGTWTFAAAAGGTQTALIVDFELELPLAGALLSKLLKVLVRKNLESMLGAMKARLEPEGNAAGTRPKPEG
jgi:ribosome-associated toxin RatA of RatAB toxin-antitoxin module